MKLGARVVEAAYRDRATAPVRDEVRAALALIETMTLRPDRLTPADIDAVRAVGVRDDAIDDVIHVCALFNTIDRLADALAFDLPNDEGYRRGAKALLRLGYALPPPLRWRRALD